MRKGETWVGWFFAAHALAIAGDLLLNLQWFTRIVTRTQIGLNTTWNLISDPIRIDVRSVGALLTGGVMIFLLARRMLGLQREKQALDGELEAARQVQELLLKGAEQAPGFEVEPAYRPARQVGGDFYFTAALPGGELLVVTGDVSGKGLRAAMLVNLVIGALRRERSSAPAEVLAGLNEVLCGQTAGGFVTCCCARFGVNGEVTVANAGHLPPYVDGREWDIESGLPLGVAPGASYAEAVVRGSYFAFVSDGVVEASNAQGDLFGFERTREISGKSAGAIAEAARAWGQNDDITVVTVRRTS
jgi:serine phosphatase RsbU (regulator of sigma subunit)